MKKSIYKPKEKKLYSYNGINSLFSTLIIINTVGIIIYELMNILIEKNYSVIYVAISAIVILAFNLFASNYYEAKKKDENKDNHWYPWIFELCIVVSLPIAMNYFLKNTEVILMIIYILLLTMHTVLVVSSAMYEYTLSDIKGVGKTFQRITLPIIILLIPLVVEVVYLMSVIKQAI